MLPYSGFTSHVGRQMVEETLHPGTFLWLLRSYLKGDISVVG